MFASRGAISLLVVSTVLLYSGKTYGQSRPSSLDKLMTLQVDLTGTNDQICDSYERALRSDDPRDEQASLTRSELFRKLLSESGKVRSLTEPQTRVLKRLNECLDGPAQALANNEQQLDNGQDEPVILDEDSLYRIYDSHKINPEQACDTFEQSLRSHYNKSSPKLASASRSDVFQKAIQSLDQLDPTHDKMKPVVAELQRCVNKPPHHENGQAQVGSFVFLRDDLVRLSDTRTSNKDSKDLCSKLDRTLQDIYKRSSPALAADSSLVKFREAIQWYSQRTVPFAQPVLLALEECIKTPPVNEDSTNRSPVVIAGPLPGARQDLRPKMESPMEKVYDEFNSVKDRKKDYGQDIYHKSATTTTTTTATTTGGGNGGNRGFSSSSRSIRTSGSATSDSGVTGGNAISNPRKATSGSTGTTSNNNDYKINNNDNDNNQQGSDFRSKIAQLNRDVQLLQITQGQLVEQHSKDTKQLKTLERELEMERSDSSAKDRKIDELTGALQEALRWRESDNEQLFNLNQRLIKQREIILEKDIVIKDLTKRLNEAEQAAVYNNEANDQPGVQGHLSYADLPELRYTDQYNDHISIDSDDSDSDNDGNVGNVGNVGSANDYVLDKDGQMEQINGVKRLLEEDKSKVYENPVDIARKLQNKMNAREQPANRCLKYFMALNYGGKVTEAVIKVIAKLTLPMSSSDPNYYDNLREYVSILSGSNLRYAQFAADDIQQCLSEYDQGATNQDDFDQSPSPQQDEPEPLPREAMRIPVDFINGFHDHRYPIDTNLRKFYGKGGQLPQPTGVGLSSVLDRSAHRKTENWSFSGSNSRSRLNANRVYT